MIYKTAGHSKLKFCKSILLKVHLALKWEDPKCCPTHPCDKNIHSCNFNFEFWQKEIKIIIASLNENGWLVGLRKK
jgi:hypothetical protein